MTFDLFSIYQRVIDDGEWFSLARDAFKYSINSWSLVCDYDHLVLSQGRSKVTQWVAFTRNISMDLVWFFEIWMGSYKSPLQNPDAISVSHSNIFEECPEWYCRSQNSLKKSVLISRFTEQSCVYNCNVITITYHPNIQIADALFELIHLFWRFHEVSHMVFYDITYLFGVTPEDSVSYMTRVIIEACISPVILGHEYHGEDI